VFEGIVPDICFIDYLGIVASSRMDQSKASDSYNYLKSVAEEIRGFAIDKQIPVVSPQQMTRDSYGSGELSMAQVTGSIGIIATADNALAIQKQQDDDSIVNIYFLKNRSTGFLGIKQVAVDYSRMRYYDLAGYLEEENHTQAAVQPASVDIISQIGGPPNELGDEFAW